MQKHLWTGLIIGLGAVAALLIRSALAKTTTTTATTA